MKRKIYIETSVVSYLVSRPGRDILIVSRQLATQALWGMLSEEYESYISLLVIQESEKGDPDQAKARLDRIKDFPVLALDAAVEKLSQVLIADGAVPRTCPEDALHIALAAVNGIDILLTWNFSHLNNPLRRAAIRRSVERGGYACPEIASPDELIGEEEVLD